MSARVLVPGADSLGECALWCDREQALYWTDIDEAKLSRWQAGDGQVRHWALPERLGSFALCERPGRLLLGLASGIAMFDLSSGQVGRVTAVEAQEPRTRINDGRGDPQGRFVFGMFNPQGLSIGGFYRVGPDLAVERLPLPPAHVANAICFSPDGHTLYFTDSPSRQLWQLDYHADGRLGEPRPFARFRDEDGEPDGAAVDAQGGVWTALWGAGCVVRLDPLGQETLRLPLPARQPTCPVFGGAALDRLFVTSARKQCEDQPQAGAVFELAPAGHRGLPAHRFRTP